MSDPKDLRKRLDSLNRRPLPQRDPSSPDMEELRRAVRKARERSRERSQEQLSQPILYQRDIPRRQPAPEQPFVPSGPPVGLEEAIAGTEVLCPAGGKAYVIGTRPAQVEQSCEGLGETFFRALARPDSNLRRRLASTCGPVDVTPEGLAFLDIETTGLMGTPLFLIGMMVWAEGDFAVRQYLARDYAEERVVISLFLDAVADKRLLVSFNGKTFDLPYIRLRAAANATPFSLDAAHFDLLHECRRIWRGVLPDCKLQTLEGHVCGRARHGDIPGERIGEAYHAFVRTGNAACIVDIVRHNVLDLITMADIMVRFPPPGP